MNGLEIVEHDILWIFTAIYKCVKEIKFAFSSKSCIYLRGYPSEKALELLIFSVHGAGGGNPPQQLLCSDQLQLQNLQQTRALKPRHELQIMTKVKLST